MILREANESDVTGMRRVRASVRENIQTNPARVTESDYIALIRRLGRTWIVESDGEIVAFASGYATGSIWALFVHPAYEGQGNGKALLSSVVDWLWSLGHSHIRLTTGVGTRAERFYLSQGWRSCDVIVDDEVRLILDRPL